MTESASANSVTLPDGSQREIAEHATGLDLAASIGAGLARAAVGIAVDDKVQDLRATLPAGAHVRILTKGDDPEALAVLRHSTAHILAEAVRRLYPGVKVAIGPAIEQGFYYDFDFPEGVSLSESDLPRIEEEMRTIINEGRTWERWEVTRDEALEQFRGEDETYKIELIEDLPADSVITFYRQGDFTDLCRGPHIQATKGTLSAFKLTSVAGAYWRGDSNRPMLTRIYGTAFFDKKSLAEHLRRIELAQQNDHRRLGAKLDLFSLSELSPGAAFWHPRGMVIWNAITEMWREQHIARGYREVKTPILYSPELWKLSGHWDVYRDNMFITEAEDRVYGLKPMNCPAHVMILKSHRHSWRELPIRLNEQGLVHRFEPSGTLHGLLRVRQFSQDDAHIFCTQEQIFDEVTKVLGFVLDLYRLFGFNDYTMELSTRPAKAIGTSEMWDAAETALANALARNDIDYTVNPGDGAFYGPKIDFHIRDSIGRTWQCGTIQLDYSTCSADRLDLTYTGEDNAEHHMVMIHRALLGSMERFIGMLIEHYGGEFPLWLSPVQVAITPIADRHNDYAYAVQQQMLAAGLRAEVDPRSESVSRKIRDAGLMHTPVVVVVGDAEQREGNVNVTRRGVDEKRTVGVPELVEELVTEAQTRQLGPLLTAQLAG